MNSIRRIIKKPIFSFIVVSIIAVLGLYAVYTSGVFTVKNISIELNSDNFISESEVSHILQANYGSSVFSVSENSVQKQISDATIYVSHIELDKVLPDTLKIRVYEYSPAFILRHTGELYWVLTSGDVIQYVETRYQTELPTVSFYESDTDTVVEEMPVENIEENVEEPTEENPVIIPTIRVEETEIIESSKVGILSDFFSEEYVSILLKIIETYSEFGLLPEEIKIHPEGVEIVIKDYGDETPWSIWMSITRDLSLQIDELALLIEDKKVNFVHYSSIDLRFNKPVVRYR